MTRDASGPVVLPSSSDGIGLRQAGPSTTHGGPLYDEALERFRATVEFAPVGIAHVDRDGHFLFVNDCLCSMLEQPRAALLQRTFADFVGTDRLPNYSRLQAELAAGDIPPYVLEKSIVRRDGSAIWVRVTVSLVPGAHGAPAYFVAVADDVSAARAEQAARREVQERLRSALNASETGTFRWALRTSAIQADEHLLRLFGLAPHDGGAEPDQATGTEVGAYGQRGITGEPARPLDVFLSRVHPDDRARAIEHCWTHAEDGTDIDIEFRVVRNDSTRWLCAKARAIRDAGGAPIYLAGACTDVTGRRQAADALREQEARFRTLANTIPQLAWMADASGSIYWYNQRWYDYTGTTLETMHGWGWQAVHHPDHVARVVARIRRCFETGEAWEDTFPLRARDGNYRWFLSRALPMRDREGRVIGWFGTNTDVTAQLETQQAERDARMAAERAIRLRDEVLAVVAHDLRNPVHTIAMSVATMIELPLDEPQRARHLGVIQRAARGMTQLIGDLLDAARIEAGTLTVRRTRVHVQALLDEALEQFEQEAQARGIHLCCEVQGDVLPVLGDRDRLLQALSNLLGNSLKFTPSGGSIRLSACRSASAGAERVEVAVQDSGAGIAPEHLPHVFDRFWQAVNSSRGGAGLGLAIVKGIVEAHGGDVRVESSPGERTVFTFTLPAARDRATTV